MLRDLNLPGTTQRFGVAYPQFEYELGTSDEYNLHRPGTLRLSWYSVTPVQQCRGDQEVAAQPQT